MRQKLILIASLLVAAAAAADTALPRVNLMPGNLTVSGVSSGGYMAVQYQVAYAKDVQGAAVIAAGPWYCAQGSMARALDECMKGGLAGPEVGLLQAGLREAAAAGKVDDPSWLAPDRIWLFHGARDAVIGAAVTDALLRFYHGWIPPERIHYESQVQAAHGFPTLDTGMACDQAGQPWLNDCDFDAAGLLLQHLYGTLDPPHASQSPGELLPFEQARYATDEARSSLDRLGYVYLPKRCAEGAPCRVHVAFHGCLQGAGVVGKAFVRDAGYNRWADANDIVVLYPQVSKSWFLPFNPKGCWDWWGYTGPDYALRSGPQLRSVHRMLDALGNR